MTIRDHLEAANGELERIACHPEDALHVAACALNAQNHALAALALLNAADVMGPGSLFTGKVERVTHRLVPDPEPSA